MINGRNFDKAPFRLYFKHFGKNQPDTVRSLEHVIENQEQKKAVKKARKDAGKALDDG